MKLKNNHKGFSLVELVIVVGIVGIIASMSIIIINRLRTANTEKVVKTISTNLTKQQMRSMSKEKKPYLYIYPVGSDYYIILSEEDSYNSSTMGNKGTKLGSGVSVYYNNTDIEQEGYDVLIDASHILRLSFKKDGTFTAGTPKGIRVKTSVKTTTIKLNESTGKFVIK